MGYATKVLKQGWGETTGASALFLSKILIFGRDEKHSFWIQKWSFWNLHSYSPCNLLHKLMSFLKPWELIHKRQQQLTMDSRSSRQTAEAHSSDKRSSQQIGEKLQDSQIHRLLNSEQATKMPRQKWPIWDLWEHVLATQHLRADWVGFRSEAILEDSLIGWLTDWLIHWLTVRLPK